MNRLRTAKASRRFYRPYYRLITVAVVITVAVITGSLMVGESVRATLVGRVHERLGNVESVLFGRHTFFGSELAAAPAFEGKAEAALLSNGFVSDAGRLLPVQVWGVDGREIPAGGIRINRALKAEISLADGEDLVLRLPAAGLVPQGSLFVTGAYTTEARLTLHGAVEAADGGNINLKNEQTIPYNIFINREELAAILGVEGKANLLLSDKRIAPEELSNAWLPAMGGIRIHARDDFSEITSDHVFIRDEAVQALCRSNPGANRLFSYLANSIRSAAGSIPYSFVTAMDAYKGKKLAGNEIILSDYSARRLNAGLGDSICLTFYYAADNLKTLHVDTLWGRVGDIVPIAELLADSGLSARFPGLSGVERCSEWDSDLPIDMGLITAADESYWSLYRTTPKAILPYSAVRRSWSNAYGSATAMRFSAPPQVDSLLPAMFGLALTYPREAGLEAACGGVDFASLFLSLGFFIILSALLLLLTPLSEMLYRRRDEIALLSSLGYTRRRIVRSIYCESLPAILAASIAGIVAGVLYTWAILLLLGSLWKGATHTGGFILFPGLTTIAAGWAAGAAASLLAIYLYLRRMLSGYRAKTAQRTARSPRRSLCLALAGALLCIAAFTAGVWSQSVAFFIPVGILFLATAAFAGDSLMRLRGSPAAPFGESKWLWGSLLAGRKRVRLAFFTLATGVFLVFAVRFNAAGFSDSAQRASGTGGYTLWCETNVPVYHNLSTPDGKGKLALTALPPDTEVLQLSRYRVDDAGCLNLNRVSQPSVLGVDVEALRQSRFGVLRTANAAGGDIYAALQEPVGDGVYPVLVDETVLTWSLMRKLGDTIRYTAGNRSVSLLLAATLDNTVFQGNLLMDKRLFSEIWSETAGSEIILFKTADSAASGVKRLVEQALHEYGVRVSTTAGRLQEFNSVMDTYLTIFLTLGGLGLLLGIVGFAIVLRKDLLSRKEQVRLCRSLGFPNRRIARLLIAENLIVPLYAIGTGMAGALAGVSAGVARVSAGVASTAVTLALLLTIGLVVFVRKTVYSCLSEN